MTESSMKGIKLPLEKSTKTMNKLMSTKLKPYVYLKFILKNFDSKLLKKKFAIPQTEIQKL